MRETRTFNNKTSKVIRLIIAEGTLHLTFQGIVCPEEHFIHLEAIQEDLQMGMVPLGFNKMMEYRQAQYHIEVVPLLNEFENVVLHSLVEVATSAPESRHKGVGARIHFNRDAMSTTLLKLLTHVAPVGSDIEHGLRVRGNALGDSFKAVRPIP
jgi:hypothetical protein